MKRRRKAKESKTQQAGEVNGPRDSTTERKQLHTQLGALLRGCLYPSKLDWVSNHFSLIFPKEDCNMSNTDLF
jgi:hypothetical protein